MLGIGSGIGLHLGAEGVQVLQTVSGPDDIGVLKIVGAGLDDEDLESGVGGRETAGNDAADSSAFEREGGGVFSWCLKM